MQHLPHKKHNLIKGEISFAKQPAHGRLIVNRSTSGWVSPTGTQIFSVFDDTRYGWIAIRIREHFGASGFIVLRVVVDKGNAFRVVVVACLLTVGTAGLCVNY